MNAIGPGDFVERMDASLSGAVQGEVRQVARLVSHGRTCLKCLERGIDAEDVGLVLVGFNPARPWCSRHWRPVYRPKSELIQTLLKSADEPVREDA